MNKRRRLVIAGRRPSRQRIRREPFPARPKHHGSLQYSREVASKYLELLRAAVPNLSRVGVLTNPSNPIHLDDLKRVQATDSTNTVTISPIKRARRASSKPPLVRWSSSARRR